MELTNASPILHKDIGRGEIMFLSDTGKFNDKIIIYLKEKIKKQKPKLIVLVGDILPLSTDDAWWNIYKFAEIAADIFLDIEKIRKNNPSFKEIDNSHLKRSLIGQMMSDYLESTDIREHIKTFKEFVNYCSEEKIKILYYAGNHDSIISMINFSLAKDYIPILNEIYQLENLIIAVDLHLYKVGKELYIMGVTNTCDINGLLKSGYEFPALKEYTKTLKSIESPEKIIFVSHIPGVEKFKNLGSTDITNFKKKFKFLYHYHGHCKDYYGEYLEHGIPTRSVHFDDINLNN